jgi:type IV pilus assembly protein PilQ
MVGSASRSAGLTMLALISLSGTAWSQEAGNALRDIQVQSTSDREIELRLILRDAAPEPLSFTIDNPARIVLDIPDTALEMASRRTQVDLGPLDTIMTAEAGGRTRAVLNLDNLVSYDTRVSGNTIIVTLAAGAAQGATAASGFGAASGSAMATGPSSIRNIDFRRTREGGGRIIVDLSNPNTAVDIRQEGGRVVALFKDTALPDELMRRLDVQDFATPVTTIDAVRLNGDTRLLINADGKYEQLAYQSEGQFAIEINEIPEDTQVVESSLFSEDKDYEGERVTLNFQDIETRAVLQVLAEISGRNIVVSDTVQGSLTLRLKNVPWDQALDIVLTTRGLDMRENGNVIIVAPAAEIAAREKADLAARQEIKELEPLFSEYLQVNYAKASDIAALIAGGTGNALLSERGSVAIDERTNTLLLQDTAERLRSIRRLVLTLDIPVRQVLIESRIVSVNDDFSRELGVRLGLTAVEDSGAGGLFSITGTSQGSETIVQSAVDNLSNTGQPFPVETPNITNRYNVNLPVANPAGQIALAVLESDYIVDLELSALQAEGRGEIVSSPRVITANQKEATIEQGVEIPYQEAASSGATTVSFKKAVLSLTVTPQITPDGNIAMDLRVSQDTVGQVISSIGGGSIPSVDTREVTTQVLVRDGQTVVLGGIYETERRDVTTKVPLLGDLPFLGSLFRSTQKVNNKSELLIFVTPKILEEGSVVSN